MRGMSKGQIVGSALLCSRCFIDSHLLLPNFTCAMGADCGLESLPCCLEGDSGRFCYEYDQQCVGAPPDEPFYCERALSPPRVSRSAFDLQCDAPWRATTTPKHSGVLPLPHTLAPLMFDVPEAMRSSRKDQTVGLIGCCASVPLAKRYIPLAKLDWCYGTHL